MVGEEAVIVGTACAMNRNDWLFWSYRVNDGAGAQRLMNKIKDILQDEKWIELWKI